MEFMAKQILSSKMGEVKKLTGEGDGEKKEEAAEAEEDPEIVKAREEAEEARKDKHRKMEEQREGMRQGIRDKVSGNCYCRIVRLELTFVKLN